MDYHQPHCKGGTKNKTTGTDYRTGACLYMVALRSVQVVLNSISMALSLLNIHVYNMLTNVGVIGKKISYL